MMNMSIACDVLSCQYNQESEHYCTLNKIKVAQGGGGKENCAGCASYKPK